MASSNLSKAFKKKKIKQFNYDRSKGIDASIYEQRAYEFLVRTQEAKEWVQDMIEEELPPGTANFGDSLRDGVVLCRLSNAIIPGFVTKINRPRIGSVLEFMATDNINQFFRVCEAVNFPKLYLFEVPDLWENKNIYKVVHTVHTLAHFLNERGKGVKIKNLTNAGLEFDEDEIQKTKDELKRLEEQQGMMVNFINPGGDDDLDDEDDESEDPLDELADPDQCEMVGEGSSRAVAGERSQFEIIAKDVNGDEISEGGEHFSIVLFLDSDPSVRVQGTVKDLDNGRYLADYTPEKSGQYTLEVHLIDIPDEDDEDEDGEAEPEALLIKGCPKPVQVAPNPVSDPTKCEVHGTGSETAVAGVESTFTLVSRDRFGNQGAGNEKFSAKLVSDSATVDATVEDNGDGTYSISYVCPMSGSYALQISLDDNDIAVGGETKSIIVKDAGVSDPGKTKLSGTTLDQLSSIRAGQPIEFTIEAKDKHGNQRESGGEQFSVELTSDDAEFVGTVTDTNDGRYTVSVNPTKSGSYKLKIMLDDEHEVASYDVTVADSGKTHAGSCTVVSEEDYRRVKAGEIRTLIVEARDEYGNLRLDGGEKFLLNIVSKTSFEPVPSDNITTKDIGGGKYEMTYVVESAGDYALEILHQPDDEDVANNIKDFPCDLVVEDSGVTDPQMTAFEGEGLHRAVSNQPAKFTILCRDKYGNNRALGGDTVEVVLINNKRKLQFNAEVTDLEDGSYEVNYLATTSGDYRVEVTINGVPVDNEALRGKGIAGNLFVEAPAAKELSEDELKVIQDHDLLSSLVNNFHVEQDNENLVEQTAEYREKLIRQIRTNTQVEQEVKDLERKIQLLINNRVKVDELILAKRSRGPFRRKVKQNKDEPGTTDSKSKLQEKEVLENYSKLFYLLQTESKYLAQLLYMVPQDKVDSFLQTTILTLYGYAFSPREEYLILNLFRETLELEIGKAKDAIRFLNQNPVLPKMVLTYGRRFQGKQFLQKVLFDKILSKILDDKELNLELNAVKILRDNISKEEVRTGVKAKINVKELTYQKAMEDEAVRKVVMERTERLTELCQEILGGIIDNVDQIPYGLRWVSKQINELLKSKHPESSDAERASVIGYIIYYRYMNPAIVSPDAFELTSKKINMNMRNNLVVISKVLTNLTNNVLFDPKIEEQMTVMNDWLKASQDAYINKFIMNLIGVGDPEETLGVHQYLELTQKKTPSITITWEEIFSTHGLLVKYLNRLAPEEDDDLRKLLAQFDGEFETHFDGDRNEEINLPLQNMFASSEIEKAEKVSPKQLYEQTKEAFRFVLRAIPTDNLGENVVDTLKIAQEQANAMLKEDKDNAIAPQVLSRIKQIEESFADLEEAGILEKSNNYRQMLVDITKEIQNQKQVRERQRKDLERLKESLVSLESHHEFLMERVKEFEAYIEDCRMKHFSEGYGGKAAKRRKRKKAKGGKHKFSYKQLKDKGVIDELNVMKSQRNKIKFSIAMVEPGIFEVQAILAGMVVKTLDIKLDDLLDRQAKGQQVIRFDNVSLNVNMTLHVLTKLFAAK